MPEVLVLGGGPVGLVTALLLARSGIDVAVWERRQEVPSGTRAIGIHPPSLELFDELGVLEALMEHAVRIERGEAWSDGRRLGSVVFTDRPVAHPFVASLEQWRTERILRDQLELVAPGALRRGMTCENLTAEPETVHVTGSDADGVTTERVPLVVVAAGGRTSFDGADASGRVHRYRDRYLMGDVHDASDAGPVARVHLHRDGVVESFPLPDGKRRYVVHTGFASAVDPKESAPTPEQLAALVIGRTGDPIDPGSTTMLSAFGVRRRQRSNLVDGRVIHLGDAAHEISPIGGQGMNLGWADARSFAPVIAEAVRAGRPDDGALHDLSRRQLAAARRAGWQAALNMRLGRPSNAVVAPLRDAVLRVALGGRAMPLLADAYTMRWLR